MHKCTNCSTNVGYTESERVRRAVSGFLRLTQLEDIERALGISGPEDLCSRCLVSGMADAV